MPFQSCVEAIARIQSNRQQQPTYKERAHHGSHRSEYLGKEECPWKRYRALSAPPDLSRFIVHRILPPKDLTFPGWTSYSTGDKLSFERRRKEENDRKYHAAGPHKPSALTPGERKGWFLSAEAEQAGLRMEREWFEKLTPKEIQKIRVRRFRDSTVRKLVRLGKVDPPDIGLVVLPGIKRKPNLAGLASSKKLIVEAYGMAERGLAQHDIAEKLGVTRSQVRTLLMHAANFISADLVTT